MTTENNSGEVHVPVDAATYNEFVRENPGVDIGDCLELWSRLDNPREVIGEWR